MYFKGIVLFQQYSKNGISVKLSTKKLNDLNDETKAVIMNLLESNMKKLYEENDKSWSDKEKMNEMFGDKNGASWYLLAENSEDGTIVGFSHFKFELDYGDEVLYVHEIQVDSKFQTKGLGRFMMQVLEMLGMTKKFILVRSLKPIHLPLTEKLFVKCFMYKTFLFFIRI